jgi:hypothetical protein
MLRLLEEAKSEHVVKDVAIHLLGISGHKPTADPTMLVSVDIKAGYVIDLTDDTRTIDLRPQPRPAIPAAPGSAVPIVHKAADPTIFRPKR